MKKSDIVVFAIILVGSFIFVSYTGWSPLPEVPSDVTITKEVIGSSNGAPVFLAVIKNEGPNTYDTVKVGVAISDSSGTEYQLKEYEVNNLKPGEERSIMHRPCRSTDTGRVSYYWL